MLEQSIFGSNRYYYYYILRNLPSDIRINQEYICNLWTNTMNQNIITKIIFLVNCNNYLFFILYFEQIPI